MARLIVRVTSTGGRAPLARLLTAPLGLDVWEVKPDYVVLQADESQADRLEAMGYAVEQLQLIEPYLSTFATAEAVSGYHTAADPGAGPTAAWPTSTRRSPSCTRSGAVSRAGPSGRCASASAGTARRKIAFMGCHHAREWIAVEVPYLLAEHLLENSSTDPVQVAAAGRGLGGPHGQPGRARAHPHREPAVAQEPAPEPGRQHRRRPQPQLRLHVGHAEHQHVQPRPVATRPMSARGPSPSPRRAPCATWSHASSSTAS